MSTSDSQSLIDHFEQVDRFATPDKTEEGYEVVTTLSAIETPATEDNDPDSFVLISRNDSRCSELLSLSNSMSEASNKPVTDVGQTTKALTDQVVQFRNTDIQTDPTDLAFVHQFELVESTRQAWGLSSAPASSMNPMAFTFSPPATGPMRRSK